MRPSVELLDDLTDPALAAFCRDHGSCTFFHDPAWHRIINASYGHECDYWISRQAGEITGVFPVVSMRLPILGRKMVAMPYQLHSGYPLAEKEDVSRALVSCALEKAKQERAKHLEVRHFAPCPVLEEMGFSAVDSEVVITTVPLPEITLAAIRRNHRRDLKKAEKAGVTVTRGSTVADLKRFRKIYRVESRQMGAPQAGWLFFEKLHELAPENYRLYLAWQADSLIGGMLTLEDSRFVFARYAAYSSQQALSLNVGKSLYWAAISDASARGREEYNCGISWARDPGLISWKEGWNGSSRPVYSYVFAINGSPPAAGSYYEGFRLAKAVWKRLPLFVADKLGHAVTTWVG